MLSGTVLVPGITSVASALFEPLLKQLDVIGAPGFRPLDLPTVDPTKHLSPNALEADIATVRAALTEAIEDKGLDVVLVGHSYGGAPCLAAAEGLWKTTREAQGKKGGLVKVAAICTALVPSGESVGGVRQEYEKDHGAIEGPPPDIEQTDMGMLLKPTGLGTTFFTDLPAAEAERWISTLRPFALEALMTPLPKVELADWNISYLLTENDKCMPVHSQEWMIERTKSLGAKIEVTRLYADHFPHISHVEETAAWLKGVLEGKN